MQGAGGGGPWIMTGPATAVQTTAGVAPQRRGLLPSSCRETQVARGTVGAAVAAKLTGGWPGRASLALVGPIVRHCPCKAHHPPGS
jgi:hypothetical protein